MELITIHAGTPCSVARDLPPPNDRRWRAHVTRRDVTGERIGGNSGAVVIRVEGWLILMRESQIQHLPASRRYLS